MEYLPAEPQGKPQNTGVMDLLDPGIEPGFPALQVDSLPTELSGKSNMLTNARELECLLLFGLNFKF